MSDNDSMHYCCSRRIILSLPFSRFLILKGVLIYPHQLLCKVPEELQVTDKIAMEQPTRLMTESPEPLQPHTLQKDRTPFDSTCHKINRSTQRHKQSYIRQTTLISGNPYLLFGRRGTHHQHRSPGLINHPNQFCALCFIIHK